MHRVKNNQDESDDSGIIKENHQSILNDEDDNDRIKEYTDREEDDTERIMIEPSPLWEHTEAFRRAVILGLIFDDDDDLTSTSSYYTSCDDSIFSNIIRKEAKSINNNHVRGGNSDDDDYAIAAVVEAGLLLPSGGGSSLSVRHRVSRGGGLSTKSFQKKGTTSRDNANSSKNNNPLVMMTSWFIREISAPIQAIPAWHGLLCSYLREQRESKLRKSSWCLLTPLERVRFVLTGRSSGKIYDSSRLDFDSSISAMAQIPSCNGISTDATKSIRVKAFAPKTFRDLRNKCFRVKEKDYAQSILNAISGSISNDGNSNNIMQPECDDNDARQSLEYDDATISNIIQEILVNGKQRKNRIRRRRTVQTLPYISFQSNSKGAARVGTFFFFTADGAFMVKTIKKEEAKAFLEMLPEYHRFMSENVNGRNSLLTRIFGMYSVQFPIEDADKNTQPSPNDTIDRWDGGYFSSSHDDHTTNLADDERVYLVMHSVFPPEASAFITERFDLKGSTVGRKCSLEERQSKGTNAVLKDLDLKREVEEEIRESNGDATGKQNKKRNTRSRHGLSIGKRSKTALMAQLERDVDLLHRCNVLDYSLLVGVADMDVSHVKSPNNSSSNRVPKGLQRFFHWLDFPMPYFGAGMTKVDGGDLSCLPGIRKGKHVMYYLGVIDFLQPWTVKKRLERDLKGLAGYDKTAISCVSPSDYSTRFLRFVNSVVT